MTLSRASAIGGALRVFAVAALAIGVLGVAGTAPVGARMAVPASAPLPLPHGSILFFGGPVFNSTGDIYAIDARGGRLKHVLADAYRARWSPDGRNLAFLRHVPNPTPRVNLHEQSDLFVVGVDGHGLRRITRTEIPNLAGPDFSWSPDGSRLAYRDSAYQVGSVIAVVGIDGRHKVRLGKGTEPVWSPDGRWIAFVSGGSLFVKSPDGTRQRQLTHGISVSEDDPPSWSPDGRRIVFYPCCQEEIDVVDVRDGRVRALRGVRGGGPSWSPDGKWIAVSSDALWLIRPDGSGVHPIGSLSHTSDAAWSPDSSTLAVTAWGGAAYDIWTVAIDGSRTRRLTQGWRYGYSDFFPEWQPQGLTTAQLAGTYVSPANPSDSVASGNSLRATSAITQIAADGEQVVIHTGWAYDLWIPAEGRVVRFSAGCSDKCLGLGLAGGRVAMSRVLPSGNDLNTGTVQRPGVVSARGVCGALADCPPVVPIDDLEGDRSLLVFDVWTGPCRLSEPTCTGRPKRNGKLLRLDGVEGIEIGSSAGALTPLSVDAGRILVDREDGTMDIRTADGTIVRTFSFDTALVRGARLQGNDLVVQTPTALKIFNASTGEFERGWPVPAADATLADLQDGIAALVAGTDIHLLRLADGKDAVIHPPGTGPVHAQLEPSGLFYAYTVDDPTYPGRVTFTPFGALPFD